VSAPREPHLDLSRLAEVGARVDALSPGRASLDPAGRRARTLVELAAAHARHGDAVDAAFVAGLARVADAQAEAFPGNLFWDFDAFAASVYAEARVAADPHALLEEVCGIACELMALFGALSPIRFRYVHDFMYGFDWARWVAREPGARHGVGPFALPFLRYIYRRGLELVELIGRGDAKYGPLADGSHRNPFGFSRSPADERRLLEDLAARRLVPVPAWSSVEPPVWDRPFAALREERARVLGVAR